MFFKRKGKKEKELCPECSDVIEEDFMFCPYCGLDLTDPEEEMQDFGLIGGSDKIKDQKNPFSQLGITEKMISSLMQNMIKNVRIEMHPSNSPEVHSFPNGIKINMGVPKQQVRKSQQEQEITEEQIQKLSDLPRMAAKTKVRRFSDKIIYELSAPGIESVKDIFVSKIESGYEIKALAKNKIYVNSLSVNLPLTKYSIDDNKLTVEFSLH